MLKLIKLHTTKVNKKHWLSLYRCICGVEKEMYQSNVDSGKSKSCGCFNIKAIKERSTTHGKSHLREYKTWIDMKSRCYTKKREDYQYYGARGIELCERWVYNFENFYSDMGPRPLGMSIDRINVNGNYTPKNCRWATVSQQNSNQRRWKKV